MLDAAIALADSDGMESLTMRRLGQALGVEAMSLYNHVANKDDILNGIIEMVTSEIALPSRDGDWKAEIRRSAISAHEALWRHRWACSLMMSPAAISPARLRWMDSVLGCLRESGFSAELTHHAYHALDSHIVGFTLWAVSLPATAEGLKEIGANFLQTLVIEDHPYLAEHIEYHISDTSHDEDGEGEGEGEFEFGLDLILNGIERIRDMDAPQTPENEV